jgi:hypothetical protein
MRFAADHSETLECFLLTSVDLDVGSFGSTQNVQTIFELLPCSVEEHVRWNSRDRIPDTSLQVIKSVNWCSEHIALDITPQEKIQWCYVLLKCNSRNDYRAKIFSSSAIEKSETLSTAGTLFL